MKIEDTAIADVKIIHLNSYSDSRGMFVEDDQSLGNRATNTANVFKRYQFTGWVMRLCPYGFRI